MRIYFYDLNRRYIGSKDIAGTVIPNNATDLPVVVNDGQEAHFTDGVWVVNVIEYTNDVVSSPKTDIELLQEKNDSLQTQLAQTNSDFASFMDYYFSINPE